MFLKQRSGVMPKRERSFTEVVIGMFNTKRASTSKKKLTKPESFDEKIVNGMKKFLESPF
ncbi:MAG: hypothetical protein CBD66_001120 [Flavobacteriaceae bacterium TMED206]|nr:hypothetical protein [Candidatus Neomarinimicrobiota bacterium]RPG63008.1 MAG: hypothetical protein CBD66_001120 [Flavobacteriaceae bacterium TMED206]|tara:strand:+ start:2279 stop:2458 length:180 start_codon:yes stop_codon:yes gene_type:complete